MESYKRISYFENVLDKHSEALEKFKDALSEFKKAQKSFDELKEYYGSDDYTIDWESSKKEDFPKDLKCGVLSEDGVYNLIIENYETAVSMMETALEIIKTR